MPSPAWVSQLAAAIRGAAGVALAASVLVLAGTLAAGQEARLYDAVVLKTLGATRARLLAAFLLEYGILGLATAIFGVLADMLAAWGIVVKVMTLDFVWLWPQALVAAAGALTFTVLLGLVGTWRILGEEAGAIFAEFVNTAGRRCELEAKQPRCPHSRLARSTLRPLGRLAALAMTPTQPPATSPVHP